MNKGHVSLPERWSARKDGLPIPWKETKMQVKEIMSRKVTWIGPEMSLQQAAKKMRDLDVGCLPVGKNDKLVGMVTDRDIACRGVASGRSPAKTTITKVMSKGVTYCFDDEDIEDAAHLMEKKQIHRLPVLNRDKRMVGILSLCDLALHAPHSLTGAVVEGVSQHAA